MIARAILPVAIAVCCLTAGCENSLLDRSLVFFTNTTIGIEVSVSPSDATAPVKLIIGYKRAEGVLNPVYHSQGVEAPVTSDEAEALTGGSSYTDKDASKSGSSSYSKKWSKRVPIAGGPKTIRRYRTEAYSVIAKIAGEVQAKAADSADARLSVAQWFATGEAAIILAKQPGIAGAVTGSSEIAKAAAKQRLGAPELDGVNLTYATLFLQAVYKGLYSMAYPLPTDDWRPDRRAKQLVIKLNALAAEALPETYLTYDFDPPGENKRLTEETKPVTKQTFGDLTSFPGKLSASSRRIKESLENDTFEFMVKDGPGTTRFEEVKLPSNLRKTLLRTASELERESDRYVIILSKNEIVLEATEYYISRTIQTK